MYLACKYFVWTGLLDQTPSLVEFCRNFSWALIDNQWISSGARVDEEEDLTIGNEHARVTAPPHAKEYCNHWWVCNAVSEYQQYVCRVDMCKKQVRTCCKCSLGYWLCNEHLMEHVAKHSKIE